MATKIALLLHRRSTVVLVLTVVAALLGCSHGFNHGGMWDGPL
ncbi:MAG TPA: hypothetical protein VGP69_04550 [Gaiellaceae bacterium]|nr:hypothetical protein [Gaiellaceae bacterium]